jgi:TolA-binding protein
MAETVNTTGPLRKNIGELLREIRVPKKTELQWHKLENDLFLRLDSQDSVSSGRGFSFALPRRFAAWTVAASGALAVVVAAFLVPTMLSNTASTAEFVSIQGNVSVTCGGKGAAAILHEMYASQAMRFARPGTVVETPSNASAILRLDKGSVLELLPGSKLSIVKSNRQNQICFLSTGSVLVKVNKRMHDQTFQIKTPCATCSVVGTIFQVDAHGDRSTTLSVFQGKVKFSPSHGIAGSEVFVETGRSASFGSGSAPESTAIAASVSSIHDISILGMLVDYREQSRLLDIGSNPVGAKVLVNGALAGKSPLIVKEPQGVVAIKICADGYKSWDTSVTVGDNRVIMVGAALSRADAKAGIVAAPVRTKPAPTDRATCESELQTMPDYIEALVDMSSGEYQAALSIFDSLSNSGAVDISDRMCLMDKINACYAKLGDFEHASEALEDRFQKAQNAADKGQLLWEMATMRANCLGDYQAAEMALVEFLMVSPNAIWAHSAYGKLAEIQFYLHKYDIAAATYRRHIATFPDDPDIDKSMFNLACILDRSLNKCDNAVRWYSRIIDSFHNSKYRSAAFFRRGECELRMGNASDAERDFRACLHAAPEGNLREMCAADMRKIRAQ